MTARKQRPSFPPSDALDRRDRRARVVAPLHQRPEGTRPALPRRVRQQATTSCHIDRSERLVAVPTPGQHRNRHAYDESRRREREEEGGPAARATLALLALWRYFLIWNFACPVDVLPLMSVASHLNVVVELTTND